ncbi:hypothetical protein Tco_1476322 [Tanacetum coccineum]
MAVDEGVPVGSAGLGAAAAGTGETILDEGLKTTLIHVQQIQLLLDGVWALRNQENRNRENTRRVVPVETTTSNALVSCDGSGYDWSDQAEEGLESVEARLLVYKKNESVCEEDIKVLKREIHLRRSSHYESLEEVRTGTKTER